MTLLRMVGRNAGFSIGSAALQFGTTLTIVYLVGPIIFADFTIDVYKMALLVVCLEVLPAPYAIFQSQRRSELGRHLASFALFSSLLCVLAWALVAALGLFAHMSYWMGAYAAYLGMQRYLDIKFQAENRVGEYYRIMAVGLAIRLALILLLIGVFRLPAIDMLWGSLAIGSSLSILVWMARHRNELKPFFRSDHGASLCALYKERSSYYPYYLNAVLKRLRDSFMPIAASIVVADRIELARYLLSWRAIEAVMGQLRVAEAILAHFGNRALIATRRNRQMLMLAAIAQWGILAAGLVLLYPIGLEREAVLTVVVASFFAYPYVFEIGFRSDAYAANTAGKVSISLSTYAATLAIGLFAAAEFQMAHAWVLVLVQVLAQTLAASSYKLGRKSASKI